MQQHEQESMKQETFINIRKLAALDIVFHGVKLILAEFAVAVGVSGFLGVFSLVAFFRNPEHPFAMEMPGFILTYIALNYLPLMLYAISIMRKRSAEREVAFELEHKDFYARKYTAQSFLLVLPLIVPVLAISQEVRKRWR